MATSPHIDDEIFRFVGEEVARKEFHPGPMARAVAEAAGRNELIQGLYIKLRHQELVREIERGVAPEVLMQAVQAEEIRETETKLGTMLCPNCGIRSIPIEKPRGNFGIFLVLTLLFVVPGLIYAAAFEGF